MILNMNNKPERGKSGGRGNKSKTPQCPTDLYLLGPRGTTRPEKPDTKRTVTVSQKPLPSASQPLSDRRIVSSPSKSVTSFSGAAGSSSNSSGGGGTSSTSVIPPIKKPKLATSLLSKGETHSSISANEPTKSWEILASDFDPNDLVSAVLDAKDNNEENKVVSLLCGAFKMLRSNRLKTDSVLCNGLLLIAKLQPSIFSNETVVTALCSVLKRESSIIHKTKINAGNIVLIVNLLYQGFKDIKRWPEAFMKLYIEDSIGERLWVDNDHCKCFTENIIASVHTRASSANDIESGMRSDDIDENLREQLLKDKAPLHVFARYKNCQEPIENMIVDHIRDQLSRRQTLEGINKNLLKFLACMCGIGEVRSIVVSKLELWLHSPKLMKSSQELLMALCINCTSHTPRDVDIVSAIAKIRLKTKALSVFYLSCIRELIPANNKNLPVILKYTVHNELSSNRNPNNMSMLSTLFQSESEKCAEILSDIFLELLISREDALKPLRILLREIARVLRPDFNVMVFGRGLMSRADSREIEQKDRVFNSIVDLISLCTFICIMPYARSDRKDTVQIERMQKTISHIQSDAIWWFHETAIRVYRPSVHDFVRGLHKVLILEPPEQYCKIDNWPPEQDRLIFLRYATEVPLLESTVIRLLVIGISKEYPLSASEAIELVDKLVQRSAALSLNIPVLTAEKPEIIDLLFNLSIYRHPENIDLPHDYNPPQMAIKYIYWKSWIILLIYCAHVPSVFGSLAWDRYPMLKVSIEMCITNRFVFPQCSDELQMQQVEKQKVLEFEVHLAAGSTKVVITENNSLLLSQLTSLEPSGPPRQPPAGFLEEIQSLNKTHKLGHLLCRSRNPDFLLDIIRKEGTSQSMPWLADLVQSSDISFNYLPVQALCEYLFCSSTKQTKYQEVILHLQNILTDPSGNPAIVSEILDYFLRRLSSHTNKDFAISGLRLLLRTVVEDDVGEINESQSYGDQCFYILCKLPFLPHFQLVKYQIIRALRESCIVENEPDLVNSYLLFLAQHATASDTSLNVITEVVYDMAQLIVERSTLIAAIIPLTVQPGQSNENSAVNALLKIFYVYLSRVREPVKEDCLWTESCDSILVTWPSGKQATFPIVVIHAIIILLSYGPSRVRHISMYNHLLEMWFPKQRQNTPRAYLIGTSEQALLLPDWLKLKMIRSGVSRLLEEALIDLEISQLLLFFQSFGLPIQSMDRLLEILDHVVATGKMRIEDLPLDKSYMIQLVDVQHRKGAVQGRIFADMLRSSKLNTSGPPMITMDQEFMDIEDVKDMPDMLPANRLSIEELEYILDNLHLDLKPGVISKRIREQRQQLLQMLSIEIMNNRTSDLYHTPVLKKVFSKLIRKCNSDMEDFVNGLLRNFHYPCRLFRLLMTTENKDHINSIHVICKAILDHATPAGQRDNLLVDILSTFTKKTSSFLDPIHHQLRANDSESQDFIKALEHSSVESIEKASLKILELETIKEYGNKQLVESIASLLRSNQSVNKTGLFIDLLVQIEPEIIGSSLDLQLEILFSRNAQWISISKCRPYLLTLLIHHASWYTLEKAVMAVLTLNSTTKYDPTAVLDFLSAVACSPKFWQGSEKTIPKHQTPKNMLRLTDKQLVSVVEYMILEVELNGYNKDILDRFDNRLFRLIEQCIVLEKSTANVIFNHLENSSTLVSRKDICNYFMIQLYLRIPSLKVHLPDMAICEKFNRLNVTGYSSSLLDTMSHAVLTSVTTEVQSRDWQLRSAGLELVIRKLASTHPFLVLRQLDILQVSLRGRTYLRWDIFLNRNYYSLFMLVLNTLELLKPHLFLSEYSKTLHAILNSFFEMFRNYHIQNEIHVMMNKFVSLLESYINNNTDEAVVYFQSQFDLFRTLQEIFPILRGLFVMASDKKDGKHKGGIVITSAWNNSEPSPVDHSNIINCLKYNDPVIALQDLDRFTLSKPMFIEPIIEQLFPLLIHSSDYIRTMSHTLLMRSMKYNPSIAKRVLPGILNCLENTNTDIIESAIESIPDLVICCQENAVPVLSKLFSLSITHNINALPCINRAISLLKLQINC